MASTDGDAALGTADLVGERAGSGRRTVRDEHVRDVQASTGVVRAVPWSTVSSIERLRAVAGEVLDDRAAGLTSDSPQLRTMTNDSGTPQATREDATSDGRTDDRAGGPDGGPDGRTAGADGAGSDESSIEPIEFADAKERAIGAAEQLIDHPIDSVIRIERDGGGWRTLVEVVERTAVPDTQDILGRYEIVADDTGTLRKYGLVERYRRGESREEL